MLLCPARMLTGAVEQTEAGRARRRVTSMSTVALSSWLAALSCSTSASHASSLAARASVPWNLAANWESTNGVICGAGCAGGPAAPPVARSTLAALPPGPPAAAARLPTRGQRRARMRRRRLCEPLTVD